MLSEADHIVKANARVTGSATLDDETVVGTMGASRKSGPMDRLLDGLFGLFGVDSRAGARPSARQGCAKPPPSHRSQRNVLWLRFASTKDRTIRRST